MFLGLRSGDKKDNKQDEIRKQYFEIYKKILNAYLNDKEKFSGIIEKNESEFVEDKIVVLLAGILVSGDFKNNEVDFFLDGGKGEVKAKFSISEDKKILHLEFKVNKAEDKKGGDNHKLDLKIPEIPKDKIIKFDDNAVRCEILNDFMSDSEFDFKLKNSELVFDLKNNFDAPQEVKNMIDNIAKDVTRNWGKEESGDAVT